MLKPFDRQEALELLRKNKNALKEYDLCNADLRYADLRNVDLCYVDLRYADLRGADLRGADLDFSCLPLRCGGLRWITDKRIMVQILYHWCSMQCDDAEIIQAQNTFLSLANKFHRAEECGKLGSKAINGAEIPEEGGEK